MRRCRSTLLVSLVLVWPLAGCHPGRSCESTPYQQLMITGVSYRLSIPTTVVAPSQFGPKLGLIRTDLPRAALRCGRWTLTEGMGTPPVGSPVYAIKGVDPKVAVAASTGTQYQRFNVFVPGE